MCVTLWAIWHARRKAIHEDIFQSPLSTHHFVENFLAELNQTNTKPGKMVRAVDVRQNSWVPPPPGMAKINIDAGVARNGDVGTIAVVARSEAGVYLGASAVHLPGVSDPEVLEAMAVREGLNLAQYLNLPRIRLAMDCLSVVKALKEVNLGSYSHIIQEIKANAERLQEVSFVHEHR
jgi:ribonuclease HI